MKNIILNLIFMGFALECAQASPSLSLDPRSMGMGGTGVAIANSSQAHYYNPSLLVSARKSEDFNILLDTALRGSDPDSLIDNMNKFGKNNVFGTFVDDLDALLLGIQTSAQDQTLTTEELNSLIAQRDTLVLSTQDLRAGIISITNRSLIADLSAGLFLSSPGDQYGWSVFLNAYFPIAAEGIYSANDDQIITNMIDILDTELNQADLVNSLKTFNTMRQQLVDTNPSERLTSNVSVYGALIREVGFSYATHSTLDAYQFDFGISPKLLLVSAFDETRTLNRIKNQQNLEKSGQVEGYTTLNFDVGLSKRLTDHWKTGLAIKNLLPQSFKTPNSKTVKLNPAARIGVGYQSSWVNLAIDLDLTENQETAGLGKSRYAAVGAELDIWLLQLRAGYRVNLSNDISYPSVGLGLYLFGLDIDAAVAAKIPEVKQGDTPLDVISGLDEINASLRAGIRW